MTIILFDVILPLQDTACSPKSVVKLFEPLKLKIPVFNPSLSTASFPPIFDCDAVYPLGILLNTT